MSLLIHKIAEGKSSFCSTRAEELYLTKTCARLLWCHYLLQEKSYTEFHRSSGPDKQLRCRDSRNGVTLQLLPLPLTRLPVLERESTGPLICPCPLANVATRAEQETPQAKCC